MIFYRMFAFFNNVPEKGLVYNFGNEEPFVKAPTPGQQKKLDDLDAKVKTAEKRYTALGPNSEIAAHMGEVNCRHRLRLDAPRRYGAVSACGTGAV